MTTTQTEDIWNIEIPRTRFTGWPTLTKAADGEMEIGVKNIPNKFGKSIKK